MNSSIKRFAAILFVASALSGAANAELDLNNFKKHADKTNIDDMLKAMLMDIHMLRFGAEKPAHIEEIFKAIKPMLVKKNTAENKAKISAYVALMSTALQARVNDKDYANIVRVGALTQELVQDLAKNKAGFFATIDPRNWGLRTKAGFVAGIPATIFGKLRTAQTKREVNTAERPGKEVAFNTAFNAAVKKSLDDKAVVKDLSELERLAAELSEVSNKDEKAAHKKTLVATFTALDYAIKAAKKNEQIKVEAERFEKNKYGRFKNRGSQKQSAKTIADLTAEIVKIQTGVNAMLKDETLVAKATVVTAVDALVAQAQAAAVKCPNVK